MSIKEERITEIERELDSTLTRLRVERDKEITPALDKYGKGFWEAMKIYNEAIARIVKEG